LKKKYIEKKKLMPCCYFGYINK